MKGGKIVPDEVRLFYGQQFVMQMYYSFECILFFEAKLLSAAQKPDQNSAHGTQWGKSHCWCPTQLMRMEYDLLSKNPNYPFNASKPTIPDKM